MPRSALALALFAALAAPALAAPPAAPAPAVDVSGSINLGLFAARDAYFGAEAQPGGHSADYHWAEAIGRLKLGKEFGEHLSIEVGGVAVRTQGADYYGVEDKGFAALELAKLTFKKIGGADLDVALGRQEVVFGDGFLLGDGYYDCRAGVWSVPLNYFDAARVDYAAGAWRATGVVAKLSPSYGPQWGALYGADVAWQVAPNATLGATRLARNDSGATDNDARATSIRGAATFGRLRLAGEAAIERGTIKGRGLDASAWHADASWRFGAGDDAPYVRGAYFFFSGDKPGTADVEGWYSWNYRWNDWNQYYLGDINGSQTFADNTDKKVALLEAGFKPSGKLRLRVFALRTRLDTGAFFGLPADAPRDFSDEVDAVVDYAASEKLSFWFFAGWSRPRDAAKLVYGDKDGAELFANMTFNF